VQCTSIRVETPVKQRKECYQAIIEKDTITLTVDVNNVNQFGRIGLFLL
jgi:hypothetical protein